MQVWNKATRQQRLTLISALGITLSSEQSDFIFDDTRIRLVSGGERAGKSFAAAIDLFSRLPWGKEFWIVGPDYVQPRAEFDYILSFLQQVGAVHSDADVSIPREGSCTLRTKSGQFICTKTAADVRKLASRSVSGILIAEAAQCEFAVLTKAIGRVSQERGWILLCGTLEGSLNWFAQLRDEWALGISSDIEGKSFVLPTWSNLAIFPGGYDDPEIQNLKKLYGRTPGLFEERCAGITSTPLGAIFRDFRFTTHVSEGVKFNKKLPVYLGIDPGAGGPSPYVVAACQFYPSEGEMKEACHVVDAVYMVGADFDAAHREVATRPWYANIIGGSIDVEAPDERKRWARVGINLSSKKVPIIQGERRLQSFLSEPTHILFGQDVPDEALLEFSLYRNPSDQSWSDTKRTGPEHFLKAIWYLLIGRFGYVVPEDSFSVVVRSTVRNMRNAYAGRGHR